MVIEVFGRYAGFTAMLPTWPAGRPKSLRHSGAQIQYRASHRNCSLRPAAKNPSRYSIVLVSEAPCSKGGEMSLKGKPPTPTVTKKLGGIGRNRRRKN